MTEHKIQNVKVVKSIQELPDCGQYVLSLPNNEAVKQVVDEVSKIVSKSGNQVLIIDTSTVSPQLSK